MNYSNEILAEEKEEEAENTAFLNLWSRGVRLLGRFGAQLPRERIAEAVSVCKDLRGVDVIQTYVVNATLIEECTLSDGSKTKLWLDETQTWTRNGDTWIHFVSRDIEDWVPAIFTPKETAEKIKARMEERIKKERQWRKKLEQGQ